VRPTGILLFGLAAGAAFFGYGLWGLYTGRISSKSYEVVNGVRQYYKIYDRRHSPGMFWSCVLGYLGIGAMLFLAALFLLFSHHLRQCS